MKGPKKNCLTPKEQGFCDDYLATGNGTRAALNNYNVSGPHNASVLASDTLRKPFVRQYLEQQSEGAAERVVKLSQNARNESVRLAANKDILDRAGFKPIEQTDITSQGDKLKFYSDEQIKRAANEIINANSNPSGTNAGDVGTASQE